MLIMLVVLLLVSSSQAMAESYHSYTYDWWGEPVPAPPAYVWSKNIRGEDLGVGPFDQPRDLCVAQNGDILISDTGNNRIVWLDSDWKLLRIIKNFVAKDQTDSFSEPLGIYVSSRGYLYVADKGNARVVKFDRHGQYLEEFGPPEGSLELERAIPEDFVYKPLKIAVDPAERLYVLAEGVYEGLIEFDVEGKFRGFIGAPRVKPTLSDIFWSRFATEAQKSRMALFLPTEYNAVDLDERGFLFVTEKNKIKRLNPAGENILMVNTRWQPVGDVAAPYKEESFFEDVAAREYGMFSVLDRQRGRVFTYDPVGNLLYVFGGLGTIKPLFRSPVALDTIGETFLVLDRRMNHISLFEPTPYAQSIHAAIKFYETGRYDDAADMWQKVLTRNVNYDLAYSGIGRAHLRQDEYYEAMVNFRLGSNRKDYSKAFQLHRRQVLGDNFGIVVTTILVFLFIRSLSRKMGLAARLRRNLRGRTSQPSGVSEGAIAMERPAMMGVPQVEPEGIREQLHMLGSSLRYGTHLIFHPFDGFWDLKYEKRGNTASASVILFFVVMTYIFMRQSTGFIFNTRDPSRLNILLELSSIVVPFFLWCSVNWALTTLMDGKGTFRDIYVATAYALVPLILINVPLTIVSNYITIEEGSFYYFLLAVAVIWAMLLLFFGTMVTHHYDVGKTLLTTILIVVGIGAVIFIGLLFFSVINLMIGFASSIRTELLLRM